jgi:hypothetical protein
MKEENEVKNDESTETDNTVNGMSTDDIIKKLGNIPRRMMRHLGIAEAKPGKNNTKKHLREKAKKREQKQARKMHRSA